MGSADLLRWVRNCLTWIPENGSGFPRKEALGSLEKAWVNFCYVITVKAQELGELRLCLRSRLGKVPAHIVVINAAHFSAQIKSYFFLDWKKILQVALKQASDLRSHTL